MAGAPNAMANIHRSGTEGLRFFKGQMGFRATWVDWQRADEPPIAARPSAPSQPVVKRQVPARRPLTPGRIVRAVARRCRGMLPG